MPASPRSPGLAGVDVAVLRLLPAVHVLLQDVDPANYADHVGMAFDALTFKPTLDALDD